MDETEALCTNIGIMVNGEFKCLGSLQNLKSRYGEGYTLLAKLALAGLSDSQKNTKVNEFIQFVLEKLNRATIKESRDGYLNIQIKDTSTRVLSTVFSLIESVKEQFSIEYYVVTQTNLEQIFLGFASKQIDPETRQLKTRSFFERICCSKKSAPVSVAVQEDKEVTDITRF
jgi:ATP-binding cassette subfamily A (ABC1) protein 3